MELEITDFGLKVSDKLGDHLTLSLTDINFLIENLPSARIKLQEKINLLLNNIIDIEERIKELKG